MFGKDHSGRVRGVGRGVTPTKYWNLPRRKSSSNERIAELEKQLDVERQRTESALERVKDLSTEIKLKDEASKQLCATVKEQGLKFDALYSSLASQGIALPSFPTTSNKCERQVFICSLLENIFMRLLQQIIANFINYLTTLFQESLRSGLPSLLPMPPKQSTQLAGTSSQQFSRSRQDPSNDIPSSHLNSQESENMASQVVPTKDPIVCFINYLDLFYRIVKLYDVYMPCNFADMSTGISIFKKHHCMR